MKFDIRRIFTARYVDVRVEIDGGAHYIGLLDEMGRRSLAKTLQDAAEDLLYGLPSEESETQE